MAPAARTAEDLRERGYAAQNMEGGMQAWSDAALPMASEGPGPPRVA